MQYFENNKNLKSDINKINAKVKETSFIFYTDNGVFNKKGLDFGTRLLLENIELKGRKYLDVGCGCGPIGIYIGIVGLIIIFIGYINKSLMPIFKFGVILTIINIIIQLKDLWNAIPFWLYLLTCGIAIISFVTYKEIKK